MNTYMLDQVIEAFQTGASAVLVAPLGQMRVVFDRVSVAVINTTTKSSAGRKSLVSA